MIRSVATPVCKCDVEDGFESRAMVKKCFLFFTRTPQRPVRSREERLNENVQHLYHQTSPANAACILKDSRMLPGATGMAGGGIYFATTPGDTDHKALNRGIVLEADVRLGRIKQIGASGDGSITFEALQRDGYDSVLIPRPGGPEYVVYNPDQVRSIHVFAKRGVAYHAHSFNKNGRFVQPSGHINF